MCESTGPSGSWLSHSPETAEYQRLRKYSRPVPGLLNAPWKPKGSPSGAPHVEVLPTSSQTAPPCTTRVWARPSGVYSAVAASVALPEWYQAPMLPRPSVTAVYSTPRRSIVTRLSTPWPQKAGAQVWSAVQRRHHLLAVQHVLFDEPRRVVARHQPADAVVLQRLLHAAA